MLFVVSSSDQVLYRRFVESSPHRILASLGVVSRHASSLCVARRVLRFALLHRFASRFVVSSPRRVAALRSCCITSLRASSYRRIVPASRRCASLRFAISYHIVVSRIALVLRN